MNAQRVVVARTAPQARAMYPRSPGRATIRGEPTGLLPALVAHARGIQPSRVRVNAGPLSKDGSLGPASTRRSKHVNVFTMAGGYKPSFGGWHHTGPVGGVVTLRASPKAAPRSSTPIAVGVRQRQRRGWNHVPGPCAGLWTAPGFPHPQHTTTGCGLHQLVLLPVDLGGGQQVESQPRPRARPSDGFPRPVTGHARAGPLVRLR